jgi:hypothetical protein
MKNFNDTIGNRSRYLPVCSAVPQPLPHRVPPKCKNTMSNKGKCDFKKCYESSRLLSPNRYGARNIVLSSADLFAYLIDLLQ